MRSLSLAGLVAFLAACTATIPEGRFICTTSAECPPGFTCSEGEGLCRSMAGIDAGPGRDLGPRDLGPRDLGSEDLGADDLGTDDLGPRDLGTGDLGTGDLGPNDLGPIDACVARTETCNRLDDDCDGTIDDGFDLANDVNNCGACGVVCGGARPGCCGGLCKDLSLDYENCGACGVTVTGPRYMCCNGANIHENNCIDGCGSLPSICVEDCVARGFCM